MKKCRVYDKHLKIIRDVKYIDFANEEVMFYADEFDGNEDEANLDMVRGFNEVNIMRFTGKLDINNEPIYEDDICISYRKDFFGDCEIAWDYIKLRWVAVSRMSDSYTKDLSDFNRGQIKIIGNIYENQEWKN